MAHDGVADHDPRGLWEPFRAMAMRRATVTSCETLAKVTEDGTGFAGCFRALRWQPGRWVLSSLAAVTDRPRWWLVVAAMQRLHG
ncbi:hypothetical protein Dimus_020364, partial [Dionaea muscipula]